MRRILYVSGTRADFGLIRSTLLRAHRSAHLRVGVAVTGMHLLPEFGATWREVEASTLPIVARVPTSLGDGTGASMGRAIGQCLIGLVDAMSAAPPDIVLVLGDRGEMLAGALAGAHLGIPVVHIHGGERSGSIDESVRHAISKIAHYHLVATEQSKIRLVHMGEHESRVFVTGAPGLDDLCDFREPSRNDLFRGVGFDPRASTAMLLFHPVTQQADNAGLQAATVIEAMAECGLQVLCLWPNSDSGFVQVKETWLRKQQAGRIVTKVHLERSTFLSWLAAVDLLVGNSSSGIIEAATFGTPVVNVGDRQMHRERNRNVVDVPVEKAAITSAIVAALQKGRFPTENIYGDGDAGRKIVKLLEELSIGKSILEKINSY